MTVIAIHSPSADAVRIVDAVGTTIDIPVHEVLDFAEALIAAFAVPALARDLARQSA